MTAYVAGLKEPKNKFPSHSNKRFLSVDEYVKIAQKVVVHYLGMRNNLTKEILNSEDVLANIATSIMMSDWRYEEGHNNAIESYRYRGAITAILNYMKYKKHRKYTRSLNSSIDEDNNQLYAETADISNLTPDSILMKEQEYSVLNDLIYKPNTVLSDRDREIVQYYFYDGLTYQEISEKYSISRERVRQVIEESLSKIRNHFNV
jgi:RNA polymerase sigma factor (sigma-70 family)